MKRSQSTPGLQLLRLILKEYATHHETGMIFQITDLFRVVVNNGDLEQFLNTWDLIMAGMRPEDRPNEAHPTHYFHGAIRKVNSLSMDMAHYERMDDEDAYEWLRRVCEKHIGRAKRAKAQQGLPILSARRNVAPAKSGKPSRHYSPRHGAARDRGGGHTHTRTHARTHTRSPNNSPGLRRALAKRPCRRCR